MKYEMQSANWLELFDALANTDHFLELFFETASQMFKSIKDLAKNPSIHSFFTKHEYSLRILNKLASRNILIYSKADNVGEILNFYTRIASPTNADHKKKSSFLPEVWKCMIRKKLLNFLPMKKRHYEIVLEDCIGVDEVFPVVIRDNVRVLIRRKKH